MGWPRGVGGMTDCGISDRPKALPYLVASTHTHAHTLVHRHTLKSPNAYSGTHTHIHTHTSYSLYLRTRKSLAAFLYE